MIEGKYGIHKKLNQDCKLTLTDLCNEIAYEHRVNNYNQDKNAGIDNIFKKFKDIRGCGLIDKLHNKLGIDIDRILDSNNKFEKYNALKILKHLYYIEKVGKPKEKNKYSKKEELKIQITDILAKPRLENINSEFLNESEYGDILERLFNEIKAEVPDSEDRITIINGINDRWELLIEAILNYVITDDALKDPKSAIDELNRIEEFLSKKIIDRISNVCPNKIDSNEKIMEIFFNILICHYSLCSDTDRLKFKYSIFEEPSPNEEYSRKYLKDENDVIEWSFVSKVENQIGKANIDSDVEEILNTISYNSLPISKDDIKHYKFALKHCRTFLNWIIMKRCPNSKEYDDHCYTNVLAAIVQEIIATKKDNETYKNDYFGYNNPKRSLIANLKSPRDADTAIILLWISKFDNRLMFNYGTSDLLQKKRNIEYMVYKIKSFIFSYHDINDLILAHSLIWGLVNRSCCSNKLAKEYCEKNFLPQIVVNLNKEASRIKFSINNDNVYNLFKELKYYDEEATNKVAIVISMEINKFYYEKRNHIAFFQKNYKIYNGKLQNCKFILFFKIDKEENEIVFINFTDVKDDEQADRLKEIGLEKFFSG